MAGMWMHVKRRQVSGLWSMLAEEKQILGLESHI